MSGRTAYEIYQWQIQYDETTSIRKLDLHVQIKRYYFRIQNFQNTNKQIIIITDI